MLNKPLSFNTIVQFLLSVAYVRSRRCTTGARLRAMRSITVCIQGAAIPACGYFGVKQHNKDLLWWFCLCNLLSGVNAGLPTLAKTPVS